MTMTLAQTAQALRDLQGSRVLVLTHAKPDGDALGSLRAMVEGLVLLGVDAEGLLTPPVPASLAPYADSPRVRVLQPGEAPRAYDAAIVLDTCAWGQIGASRPHLEPLLPRTLIVDHHLTGDLQAPRIFSDTGAAATGEMVFDLLSQAGIPVGLPGAQSPALKALREGLYLAIASDTGWFRFSNTSAGTLRRAAALRDAGTDALLIYERTMQQERPARLKLMGLALSNLRYVAGGRAAIVPLSRKDFQSVGAQVDDYEGFADLPRQIGSVQVACLVTEVEMPGTDGRMTLQTRLSFRSKPDIGEGAVDCTKLAAKFGGGGHARAAGAKVDAPLAEVMPRLEAILAAL